MKGSPRLSFWLCALILLQLNTPVYSWKCGSNWFSSNMSWALTFQSNREGINSCCKTHNYLYSFIESNLSTLTHEAADSMFEACLERACVNKIDKYVVKPIFANAAKLNTWLNKKFNIFN